MKPAPPHARWRRSPPASSAISASRFPSDCSCNKFLAKVASDLDKPRGFAVLDQDARAPSWAQARRIHLRRRTGNPTAPHIENGFRIISDLQRAEETDLMKRFGDEAAGLATCARGIDTRKVIPDHDAKTVSSETTFDKDLSDFASLEPRLWRLSERVAARLKTADLSGTTITLKLKTKDFRQRTRSRSVQAPTQLAMRFFSVARDMLTKEIDGTAFRLLGVGVSALQNGRGSDDDTISLTAVAPTPNARWTRSAAAFGDDAIMKGLVFKGSDGKPARR